MLATFLPLSTNIPCFFFPSRKLVSGATDSVAGFTELAFWPGIRRSGVITQIC